MLLERFLKKIFPTFGPLGRYVKAKTKKRIPLTRDTEKQVKAHISHTHTATQHSSSKCWSCGNPAAPTRHTAPTKALTITQTLGEVLRHRLEAEPKREGTPAPAPAPVAHVAQRGPLPRIYSQSIELHCSVGPKGRHSYSTATKLGVVDNTRLRCYDGGVVGTVEPC